MPNLLSVHWIPVHGRNEDLEYFQTIAPAVLKTVDADVHRVAQAYEKCGAKPWYYLRDWALSEQKSDMQSNPVGTGVRHAKERIEAARRYNVPQARIVLCGINEPAVWEDMTVVPYTVAFLDELTKQGFKGTALNLSVGWPANKGGSTPPDWEPYTPVLAAIKRGGHFLCLHEYWDHRGPDSEWGWKSGRYTKCPWDVPIIIGEFGLDEYVTDASVPADKRGWQGWMDATQYAVQVRRYLGKASEDKRIVGCCLYTTDYGHPWSSFDTYPAHPQLSAIYVNNGSGVPSPIPPGPEPAPTPKSAVLPLPANSYRITNYWNASGNPRHEGIDLGAAAGIAVQSIADGVVAYVGDNRTEQPPPKNGGYGLYIRVWHPQLSLYSFYAHLNTQEVKQGDKVTAGQRIGGVGTTGNSTGNHLHFEVRLAVQGGAYNPKAPLGNGRADPESILAQYGVSIREGAAH